MGWKLWQRTPRVTEKSLSDSSSEGFKLRKKHVRRPYVEKIPELNKVLIIFPATLAGVMFFFAFVLSGDGLGVWFGSISGGISVFFAIAAWRVRYRPLMGDDGWQGVVERKLRAIKPDGFGVPNEEQLAQKEASEKAAKAGLAAMAKRRRQKLYKRVRGELLKNGVSVISAEDDLATQEQREEFFEELAFEFSTMEGKSLEQSEEIAPTHGARRLRGDDEDYFGRIIRVIEDEIEIE